MFFYAPPKNPYIEDFFTLHEPKLLKIFGTPSSVVVQLGIHVSGTTTRHVSKNWYSKNAFVPIFGTGQHNTARHGTLVSGFPFNALSCYIKLEILLLCACVHLSATRHATQSFSCGHAPPMLVNNPCQSIRQDGATDSVVLHV